MSMGRSTVKKSGGGGDGMLCYTFKQVPTDVLATEKKSTPGQK